MNQTIAIDLGTLDALQQVCDTLCAASGRLHSWVPGSDDLFHSSRTLRDILAVLQHEAERHTALTTAKE
jgi:hypothetical protein